MKTSSALSRFVQLMYSDASSFPTGHVFYDALMTTLAKEDIGPQVYQVLSDGNRFGQLPEHVQAHLRAKRNQALVQNLVVKRETDRVIQQLDEAKIPVICLKGTRFAERYYGHVAARGTNDIDVLVLPGDVQRAEAVLCGYGYAQPFGNLKHDHYDTAKHTQLVKAVGQGRYITVELHHHIIKPKLTDLDIASFWFDSTLVDGYTNVWDLSEQHTFYATCIHAANHFLDFMKHRLDMVHLLARKNSRVSLSMLATQAEQDGTTRLLAVVLSSLYDEFPFLHQIQPLPPALRTSNIRRRMRFYLTFELAIRTGWRRRMKHLMSWVVQTRRTVNEIMNRKKGEQRLRKTLRFQRLGLQPWQGFSANRTHAPDGKVVGT